SCLPWIFIVACRYQARGLPLADITAAGTTGACIAVDTFDVARECRLRTYADAHVLNHIRKAFGTEGPRPIHVPLSVLSRRNGCSTKTQELALAARSCVSLDLLDESPAGNGEGPHERAVANLDGEVDRHRLINIMERLSPQYCQVLVWHSRGATLREIGERLGVSVGRAWAIKERAFRLAREEAEIRGWRCPEGRRP
ncbi:MAG: sigma factor, partial [Planctomycetota bacterium]